MTSFGIRNMTCQSSILILSNTMTGRSGGDSDTTKAVAVAGECWDQLMSKHGQFFDSTRADFGGANDVINFALLLKFSPQLDFLPMINAEFGKEFGVSSVSFFSC